jgi:hypothetical protein
MTIGANCTRILNCILSSIAQWLPVMNLKKWAAVRLSLEGRRILAKFAYACCPLEDFNDYISVSAVTC